MRLPEDDLGLIPHLDQYSIFPYIFRFFSDTRGLSIPAPIRDQSFGVTGALGIVLPKSF